MDDTSSTPDPYIDRGGSQADLRRYNERVVLAALRQFPGLFNAELARRTGLAAQTISVILRSLEDQGLILRGPVLRGRRGQPATPIYLNPEGAFALGCEVGWRHFCAVATNFEGRVLQRVAHSYAYPEPEAVTEQICTAIDSMIDALPQSPQTRLAGVGLAMPNNIADGLEPHSVPATTLEAWRYADIAEGVRRHCACPVHAINDGLAASRAETLGDHAAHPNFAYLFIGTFVGGGLVINGRVFEGLRGNAANLGAMIVPGPQGGGVVPHMTASIFALRERLRTAGHTALPEIDEDWDWRGAEEVVGAWIEEAGFILAHVVANTAAAIEFDTVVIDGMLPRPLMDRLVASVRRHLAPLKTPAFGLPMVDQGWIGLPAAAIGAAGLAIYRAFFMLEAN